MSKNLTPKEAAAYLASKGIHKSESALGVARHKGYPAGPRFLKVGTAHSGRVFYPLTELDEWIKHIRCQPPERSGKIPHKQPCN